MKAQCRNEFVDARDNLGLHLEHEIHPFIPAELPEIRPESYHPFSGCKCISHFPGGTRIRILSIDDADNDIRFFQFS